MKPKKFKKKLALSKVTIANLSGEVLVNIRGGADPLTKYCPITGKTDCETNCIHTECYHNTCINGCTVTCDPCTIIICTINPDLCTNDTICKPDQGF